jgi:hypothetical protein
MSQSAEIIRLIQFDKSWLSRITKSMLSATTPAIKDFAYAELCESYFWLAFGVEVGYYPIREASLLSRQRFTPLFEGLREFLKFRGYYVAPVLADRLTTDLNKKTILSGEVNCAFSSSPMLMRFFQIALALETEIAEDETAQRFFSALATTWPDAIRNVLEQKLESNDESNSVDKALLVRGFMVSLQHLDAFRNLDQNIAASTELTPTEGGQLKLRIHQLVRWRMNFENPFVQESFPLIAQACFESTPEFGGETDYWNWVLELAKQWGYQQRAHVAS